MEGEINKCYRVGNNTRKERPVIMKFKKKQQQRKLILKNTKKLKGTKIVVVEDLIRSRLDLLKEAKAKYDRKLVYTFDGNVYISMNGTRYKLRNITELNNLISNESDSSE